MIRFGKDDGSSPTIAPTVRGCSRCQRLAAQVVELEAQVQRLQRDASVTRDATVTQPSVTRNAERQRRYRERKAAAGNASTPTGEG